MFISKSKKSPFLQLTYEVNGKRTTVSAKTTNLQEAYKFMGSFSQRDGFPQILPHEQKQQIKNIMLSKFNEEYSLYVSNSKSKSYLRSISLSFSQLKLFCGDININRIDTRTLDKFITTVYVRAPKAASLYYRTLKASFSKAVVWNYLSENPFKKIKAPKPIKTFPVFISSIEFQNIIANSPQQYLKDLFITAFYTGMRLGEILNMKWNWIDFQQNIIKVQCSESFTTKSKKERIIPISQTLRNVLLNQFPKVIDVDKNNFVFVRTTGVKLNENFISKQFKKSVRAAGLDDRIHFHTLRHSFASMLVQRGVSLYVVKELLGHEDLSTTQIYSHLQKQNLMDAVNLL